MEGKMVALTLGVTVLMAFLSSLQLAASARDPQAAGRLHLQGGGGVKTSASGGVLQLECCNICRQTPWDGWYACEDRTEMERGCNGGCRDCRCDPARYPSCRCLDRLYRCPPSCDDYIDSAAAASMAERPRA